MDNVEQKELMKKFDFSEDEIKLASGCPTEEVKLSCISEIYAAKQIREGTERLIKSNEQLSESTRKYAKGMFWFTGALVFVGLCQIVVAIIMKS